MAQSAEEAIDVPGRTLAGEFDSFLANRQADRH
jgi:hypothetical protein